jgi:hypothetical protein
VAIVEIALNDGTQLSERVGHAGDRAQPHAAKRVVDKAGT